MLQLNELLEPISQASPAGHDLTFSMDVDAIHKARLFDDPSLDQGEWVVALKEADWEFVYAKCSTLLATQTKDLRIAGWLVEAAAKTREFEGLAAGFELVTGMCDHYWDVLYPLPDGSDVEQRVGNVTWLLSRSVQLVKEIPLTEGRETAFSWTDFEAARTRANNAARTGEISDDNSDKPDLAQMESARRKSSRNFYETLVKSASHCRTTLAGLEQALDVRLGVEGPSFTPLKEILETVLGTAERFGADVGLKTVEGGLPEGIESVANATTPGPVAMHGQISSREQALEQLRQVAIFFRRTEPHSPVAYLADKAATWGDLPLHAWLRTVIKDANSLAFIEEMLGVKLPNSAATDQ
jgi:type VI secretion system protein ImpA